jgi:HEAT repeat protein
MTAKDLQTTSVLAGAAALTAQTSPAAETVSVDELITRIKSADDKIRGPAWQGAARYGARAVRPLAEALTDANFEVSRSAKRALYVIIRHAGRPGAAREAKAVETELMPLLKSESVPVRREVLWMLSEIGGNDSVAPMAALLTDKEVREDARCALLRIPGNRATAALKSAFAAAPEDFKFALADALRRRGQKVDGYPSQKLVPTRQTTVSQPKTT